MSARRVQFAYNSEKHGRKKCWVKTRELCKHMNQHTQPKAANRAAIDKRALAARVIQARREKSWTQAVLSQKSGVATSFINKLEQAALGLSRADSMDKIVQLTAFMGVEIPFVEPKTPTKPAATTPQQSAPTPAEDPTKSAVDQELVIISKMATLLSRLPSSAAKQRVLGYLAARASEA